MASRSALNNSQWKTIPLHRVGTEAQKQRWDRMVLTYAVETRQLWKTNNNRKEQ